MTDSELAALAIEDRNRILDAWWSETVDDFEAATARAVEAAELDREYSLLDEGPLPGYDAYDMEVAW